MNYRSDIDGLRAIAVVSVVLYHAATEYLPGGYFGVDIFFVISGFLISNIIWNEIQEKRFSLLAFYERRVRRILPIFFVVLSVTAMAAVLILLPSDLIGFSRSALAAIFFSANIYFWRDTNYFAPSAEEKPLLHIWSLSAEEQFYFLFPLFLLILVRLGFKHTSVSITVVLLTAASIAASVLLVKLGAVTASFFLLPSRAWEMGAGAILALGASPINNATVRTLLGLFGLFLTSVAILFSPALPGFLPAPTLAVLGASLLIWAGMGNGTLIGKVLGFKPFVAVGLISYSLYLWHWPMIVLTKYYLVRDLYLHEIGLLLLAMTLLSYLTWRYVEQPFRKKKMTIRRVLLGIATLSLPLLIVVVASISSQGLPARYSAEISNINSAVGTNYRCKLKDFIPFGASRACFVNNQIDNISDAELVILGNSHAQMYVPAIRPALEELDLGGVNVPLNRCLPTVTLNINDACLKAASRNLQAILDLPKVSLVVIGLTWNHQERNLYNISGKLVQNEFNDALHASIDDLVSKLSLAGIHTVLIAPIMEPGTNVASIRAREMAFDRESSEALFVSRELYQKAHGKSVAYFSDRADIQFVRSDVWQCDETKCYFVRDGYALFSDSNHFAAKAVEELKPDFYDAIRRSLDRLPD